MRDSFQKLNQLGVVHKISTFPAVAAAVEGGAGRATAVAVAVPTAVGTVLHDCCRRANHLLSIRWATSPAFNRRRSLFLHLHEKKSGV